MAGSFRFEFSDADLNDAFEVRYRDGVHGRFRCLLQFLKLRAKEVERVWSLLRHLFARMQFLTLGRLNESLVHARIAIECLSVRTNKVFIKIKSGLRQSL